VRRAVLAADEGENPDRLWKCVRRHVLICGAAEPRVARKRRVGHPLLVARRGRDHRPASDERHRETQTIDITFEILEGPRVFVERVDIRGNTRTLDRVIRREFRLVEGDAFNSAKLQRSQQRIRNLGYFANVDVNRHSLEKDRDAIRQAISTVLDGVRTVHHGHMPEIEITGPDAARGVWAMFDYVEFPTSDDGKRTGLRGYGHYMEEYVREDGEWRISHLHLSRLRIDTLDD
jgi:hypothetical protein